ncbi:MAG: sensor histidine kinase, partial [Solirubrobacteraceae bacterium]|nr:sensor histidine kinase [Solirubrobacteraceae bacterium]
LIERGLTAALEDLTDRSPIPVTLQVDVGERSVGAVAESAVYFVIAEAVTNSLRHAAATRLWITVKRVSGHVQLEVVDDGAGGARPAPGRGLSGLRERVQALGGRVQLESPPGRGTRLVAEVPCAS